MVKEKMHETKSKEVTREIFIESEDTALITQVRLWHLKPFKENRTDKMAEIYLWLSRQALSALKMIYRLTRE